MNDTEDLQRRVYELRQRLVDMGNGPDKREHIGTQAFRDATARLRTAQRELIRLQRTPDPTLAPAAFRRAAK